MIRQTIVLNDYTYILDLYKASSDLKDNKHYEEFVLIRKTNIMNSIMFDKDVYFIQKSLVDSCMVNGVLNTTMLSLLIAYPVTQDGTTLSYSFDFKNFNTNYTDTSFVIGTDIFNIYSNDCKSNANVLCDKIRVWLPITNSKLNGIIHVTNLINDIRFHYVCRRASSFETTSKGEMKVGNNIYSEYFDIWVPNAEYLFGQSNCYIKEDFNLSEIRQKIVFNQNSNNSITIQTRVYFDFDGENIVKKFKIEAVRSAIDLSGYDLYVNEQKLEWNYAQTSTNSQIIDGNNIEISIRHEGEAIAKYDLHHNEILFDGKDIYMSLFLMILPFYIDNYSFDDNGDNSNEYRKCKLYCDINSSMADETLITPLVASIYHYDYVDETSKQYCQENAVLKNADVFTLTKDIKLKASFEFCNDKSLLSYGALMLNCIFSGSGNMTEDELNSLYMKRSKCTIYDYMHFDVNDDNYDVDLFPEEINKCGFIVEMAPDNNFKDILYKYVKNINIGNENDMPLSNCMFGLNIDCGQEQWDAYPETLVVRVKYIDKVSFNIITSNSMFVTKEIFKYLINGNGSKIEYRLHMHDNNQIYEDETVDLQKFNFIDKINCVIVKNETDNENSLTNAKTTSKIVYKPIFFKAKDLQQIKIKSGITQNIGLNLSDFISKVDTFKITINEKEYSEIARNDGYVIFRLNALELSESSGQYNLLNQDNEYISDGTWYTY